MAGTNDQIDFLLRELAQFAIGKRRTFLQDAERSHDRPAPAKALDANWKVHV